MEKELKTPRKVTKKPAAKKVAKKPVAKKATPKSKGTTAKKATSRQKKTTPSTAKKPVAKKVTPKKKVVAKKAVAKKPAREIKPPVVEKFVKHNGILLKTNYTPEESHFPFIQFDNIPKVRIELIQKFRGEYAPKPADRKPEEKSVSLTFYMCDAKDVFDFFRELVPKKVLKRTNDYDNGNLSRKDQPFTRMSVYNFTSKGSQGENPSRSNFKQMRLECLVGEIKDKLFSKKFFTQGNMNFRSLATAKAPKKTKKK